MLIYHAAKEVVEEEGFDEMLDTTRARVDEIEGGLPESRLRYLSADVAAGLHRQSEITIKEPFRMRVPGWFGKRTIEVEGLGASFVPAE